MKKNFAVLLCAALAFAASAAGTPLTAATSAKTFAAAQKRNAKDGILVYFYGPDWDVRSTEMLKTFWDNADIKKACGDAVMVAAPIYQDPSEKEHKLAQEARAGMRVPHIYSYPAVVMMSSNGEVYYILTGDEILADTATVAATIAEKLKLERERKDLRAKANKAKGIEKAKLLGQIAETYGEDLFGENDDHVPHADSSNVKKVKNALIKELKACDPNGETPYAKQLEFDVYKVVTNQTHKDHDNPNKVVLSPADAFALAKKLAIDDKTTYRPLQRQKILAAVAAYLRRTDRNDSRIMTLYKEIIRINPNNEWASFARESDRVWGNGTLAAETQHKKKKKHK